jgi:hypothetical protein
VLEVPEQLLQKSGPIFDNACTFIITRIPSDVVFDEQMRKDFSYVCQVIII